MSIISYSYLSHDILNIIFSYIQSNTNTIMKEHINDVEPHYVQNCKRSFCPHKRENHLKIMMKKSTVYGIKHFTPFFISNAGLFYQIIC